MENGAREAETLAMADECNTRLLLGVIGRVLLAVAGLAVGAVIGLIAGSELGLISISC